MGILISETRLERGIFYVDIKVNELFTLVPHDNGRVWLKIWDGSIEFNQEGKSAAYCAHFEFARNQSFKLFKGSVMIDNSIIVESPKA